MGVVDTSPQASRDMFLGRLRVLLWFAVFLAGAFLLWFRIGREALWYDETYSLAVVEHPFSEIVMLIAGDVHPPLYFLMLKAWVSLFGTSPVAARSLSAVGVLALAGLGVFPLRRLWPNSRALIFSLLCFLTPMSIVAGQEIRMYSWLAFFVTATVTTGCIVWMHRSRMALVAMVVFSLAAAYTHYFGLLAVAISWLVILIAITVRQRVLLQSVLAGAAVTVIGYLPWLTTMLEQIGRVQSAYWIEPVTLIGILWAIVYPFSFKFTVPWIGIPALVFAGLVVIWGCYRALRQRDRASIPAVAGLAIYLLTLTTAIATSLVAQPVLQHRYMLSGLGLLLLALAYGIHRPSKGSWTLALLACFAMATAPTLAGTYLLMQNGPMLLVRDDLTPRLRPDDVFVHNGEHNFGTFSYHFPTHRQFLFLPAGTAPNGNYAVFDRHGSFGDDLSSLLDSAPVIWLTYSSNEPVRLSPEVFRQAGFQSHPKDPQTFDIGHPWYSIRVFRFEKR